MVEKQLCFQITGSKKLDRRTEHPRVAISKDCRLYTLSWKTWTELVALVINEIDHGFNTPSHTVTNCTLWLPIKSETSKIGGCERFSFPFSMKTLLFRKYYTHSQKEETCTAEDCPRKCTQSWMFAHSYTHIHTCASKWFPVCSISNTNSHSYLLCSSHDHPHPALSFTHSFSLSSSLVFILRLMTLSDCYKAV